MSGCPNFGALQHCNASFARTYLRPDQAISIIPWLYSALMFLVHLPLVLIRVLKWETGQVWSLVMATFSAALTILAYSSSKLDADQVYIWMPVALIMDVGAMTQVFVLIIEEADLQNPGSTNDGRRILRYLIEIFKIIVGYLKRERPEIFKFIVRCLKRDGRGRRAGPAPPPEEFEMLDANSNLNNGDAINLVSEDHASTDLVPGNERPIGNRQQVSHNWRAARQSAILIISALLFLLLITLQLVGLTYANKGYDISLHKSLNESWCSPAFQVSQAVYDSSSCQMFNITQTLVGTGCIDIPGDQQAWLDGVRVVLIFEIVFQLLDLSIMIAVKSSSHCREIKLKRPWCTMGFGIVVWVALIGIGYYRASVYYPLDSRILVIEGGTTVENCTVVLNPAGLRGSIIAWSDGVMSGWNSVYFGVSSN